MSDSESEFAWRVGVAKAGDADFLLTPTGGKAAWHKHVDGVSSWAPVATPEQVVALEQRVGFLEESNKAMGEVLSYQDAEVDRLARRVRYVVDDWSDRMDGRAIRDILAAIDPEAP